MTCFVDSKLHYYIYYKYTYTRAEEGRGTGFVDQKKK